MCGWMDVCSRFGSDGIDRSLTHDYDSTSIIFTQHAHAHPHTAAPTPSNTSRRPPLLLPPPRAKPPPTARRAAAPPVAARPPPRKRGRDGATRLSLEGARVALSQTTTTATAAAIHHPTHPPAIPRSRSSPCCSRQPPRVSLFLGSSPLPDAPWAAWIAPSAHAGASTAPTHE